MGKWIDGRIDRQTDVRKDGCTDGWTDERMDGWMFGHMDGCMHGQTDRRTGRRMDRWMGGRMDGWTDGRTDGWTDGRIDVQTDGRNDRKTNTHYGLSDSNLKPFSFDQLMMLFHFFLPLMLRCDKLDRWSLASSVTGLGNFGLTRVLLKALYDFFLR
jgi:hypothetical protein